MWVKLDDNFADHPKVTGLSHPAFRVLVSGLCYANRFLTDGVLNTSAQKHLGCTKKLATELVRSGLWEIGVAGSFLIHDYEKYQPTRLQAIELRKVRAEAGRIGGLRSGMVRREAKDEANASSKREAKSNPVPDPVPVGSYRTVGRRDGLRGIGATVERVATDLEQGWSER